MSPSRSAGKTEADGRYRKAVQFADAAALFSDDATDAVGEFGDAHVTLAVHSGMASADVIAISIIGEYAPTGDHVESVAVLKKADAESAKHLERLLAMKTKAGYAYRPASADDVAKARRAHEALLGRAAEVQQLEHPLRTVSDHSWQHQLCDAAAAQNGPRAGRCGSSQTRVAIGAAPLRWAHAQPTPDSSWVQLQPSER